jgi:hypothetical protein
VTKGVYMKKVTIAVLKKTIPKIALGMPSGL